MLRESRKLILKMWSSTSEQVKKSLYENEEPDQRDQTNHNEAGDVFYQILYKNSVVS